MCSFITKEHNVIDFLSLLLVEIRENNTHGTNYNVWTPDIFDICKQNRKIFISSTIFITLHVITKQKKNDILNTTKQYSYIKNM